MGDYKIGYVENPDILLADTIAASAGFPVLIGPYKLRTDKYDWIQSSYAEDDWTPPKDKYLHLWDGGVYDNLGLEDVYKINKGGYLSKDINYLIVSNASGGSGYTRRKSRLSGKNLKRLLDIAMQQVEALRNRTVMDFIERTGEGMYLNIGNSASYIIKKSEISDVIKEELIKECISAEEAQRACDYPTTLRKPSEANYNLLLRHGYEVAKCTYVCYKD